MSLPFLLTDIRNKVRRITGRPNTAQISDAQIDQYINTYYVFDLSEQLRLESFRVNYQFVTNANQPAYDFPKNLYLTDMPPVYIGGYQSYFTQSRENFFRFNSQLTYYQQNVATGNGTVGPYSFTLTAVPVIPGFKPNGPYGGAYTPSVAAAPNNPGTDVPASVINWNVMISGQDINGTNINLVDDGGSDTIMVGTTPTSVHSNLGLLFDPNDQSTLPALARGTINYLTGQVNINAAPGFNQAIANGSTITCQSIPYVASRPRSACFFQDQILLYPTPDNAYTVSFEAFQYPTAFMGTTGSQPLNGNEFAQLKELWQLLAYGASDKIFADAGDMESLTKFRPLLEEQMKLCQRRTIVQYTSDRTATIYSDVGGNQYPWGNQFGGF